MTVVTGEVRRSLGYDSFDDLTDAPVLRIGGDFVSFDADLDDATIADIRARMTSRDDADQARRATLAAHRDANTTALADPATPDAERVWRQQNNDLIDAVLGN